MDTKIALVFPGQGCQFVGMGSKLYASYEDARALYDRADEILGFSLSRLCFEGPPERLNDTANTQPAIYTTSMALWKVLAPRLGEVCKRIVYTAGHSLGEFTALTAAGALRFEDGLRLVRERGRAMHDAGEEASGGMAAIIGLEDEEVAGIVAEANADGQGVWIANYNSPGQVVIAGEKRALERAVSLAEKRKAKRAIPLKVSVACHTPFMEAAADRLGAALEETAFRRPNIPVVSNVRAIPLQEPQEIKEALLKQLNHPVRWVESVQTMVDDGVEATLEVGPRAVVSGLIRRIHRPLKLYEVTDVDSLEALDMEAEGV
ncbi:MAG: ACP S-malonyltransferase [Chloroflexota bacterium]|nr:ACP S-malonyltransferase [Chloroflexota bacterium]